MALFRAVQTILSALVSCPVVKFRDQELKVEGKRSMLFLPVKQLFNNLTTRTGHVMHTYAPHK
jgi:hypothetical protein